ncbi:MAG: sugar phosphate isomerase/epimerase family protein [bacterium]
MKIGVSTYSYSRLVAPGKMSIFDVVQKVKEMGFGSIEFAGLQVPEGVSIESAAVKLRELCASNGLVIASYTIGADLLNGSGGNLGKEIERLRSEVRIAKLLNAPLMRHDATRGFSDGHLGARGFTDALPILIEGCRAVTSYAESVGIRTMVENHGYFCQDSERVEQLVNGVNHANFGVLLDIGNFLCVDEDTAKAVARLIPYVFHVHIKDFHVKSGNEPDPGSGWFQSRAGNYLRGSVIGHGNVPVQQCLRLIRRAGYDGVVSIEFEGMEDPLTGIGVGRDNLARFLRSAGG